MSAQPPRPIKPEQTDSVKSKHEGRDDYPPGAHFNPDAKFHQGITHEPSASRHVPNHHFDPMAPPGTSTTETAKHHNADCDGEREGATGEIPYDPLKHFHDPGC